MVIHDFERRYGSRRPGWLALAVVLVLVGFAAVAQTAPPVDKQVVQAALAEDWSRVVSLLGGGKEEALPAVARLIKGHACLTLNRNNESACLFLSAAEKSHLEAWDAWTSEFHKAHPASASARYFRGDALARLGQYEPALRILEAALKDAPSNVLLFNAIGVIQTKRGELRTARVFFQEATRQRRPPALADAYANIAALLIQQKEGPEGALSALNTAVDISPNFALALHSRACIHLIMRKPALAKEDFSKAADAGPCGGLPSLFAQNVLKAQAYWAGLSEQELLARLSEEKAGTTIRATVNPQQQFQAAMSAVSNYAQTPTQANANILNRRIAELRATNPGLADNVVGGFNKILTANPSIGGSYTLHSNEIARWNSLSAPVIADTIKTWSGIAGQITGLAVFKSPQAGLGGSIIGTGAGKMASDWINNTSKMNLDTVKIIRNTVSPNTPLLSSGVGGVDTDFGRARWDEGEWPFVAYYGLFYP